MSAATASLHFWLGVAGCAALGAVALGLVAIASGSRGRYQRRRGNDMASLYIGKDEAALLVALLERYITEHPEATKTYPNALGVAETMRQAFGFGPRKPPQYAVLVSYKAGTLTASLMAGDPREWEMPSGQMTTNYCDSPEQAERMYELACSDHVGGKH